MKTAILQHGKPTVFVALVHETVKTETFETYADLVEAVKLRAVRLRLAYSGDVVWAAIQHVEHVTGRCLVGPLRQLPVEAPRPVRETWSPPVITREEAPQILEQIWTHLRGRP